MITAFKFVFQFQLAPLQCEMRTPAVHIRPSLVTWTAIISACARGGDVARACEAFDRMTASGLQADTRAWTALMKAHALQAGPSNVA
jgi:pentatricopeptide repeat protein